MLQHSGISRFDSCMLHSIGDAHNERTRRESKTMPQIVQTTVYSIAELTPEAREKARDWYRTNCADFAYESQYVTEDFTLMMEIIGISVTPRSFCWDLGRGNYATFEAFYCRYKKGSVKAIKAECGDADLHVIARKWADVQKRYFYALSARVKHAYTDGITVYVHNNIKEDDASETAEAEVKEVMQECCDWLLKHLKSAAEYCDSDECIDGAINANEYLFTAEGEYFRS